MRGFVAGVHLSDGDLVRLLDGQAEPGESARGRDHLAACVDCDRRLRDLQRRSASISALLAGADFDVPPALRDAGPRVARRARAAAARRKRIVWLRAASICAILLGAGILAGPARARVTDWVSDLWTGLLTGDRAAGADAAAPQAQPDGGTRVRFTPTGPELSIEFASVPDEGRVELRVGDGPTTVVEVLGGVAEAELLVLPAGVRVLNEPGAGASYRVTVPTTVRIVRIAVDDSTVALVPIDSATSSRTLDLRVPAP